MSKNPNFWHFIPLRHLKKTSLPSQRVSNFPSSSIFFILNISFISYFFSQRIVFQCLMSFCTHSHCINREKITTPCIIAVLVHDFTKNLPDKKDHHNAFLELSISRHVIQMYRDNSLFSTAITITPEIRFFRKNQKLAPASIIMRPWNNSMICFAGAIKKGLSLKMKSCRSKVNTDDKWM